MKAERKYLAHYLDAAFDRTYQKTEYVRLGKDLEKFSVELNPDLETVKNILGENSVVHNGYDPTSDADPFYYEYDEALSKKIMEIALGRLTGDACRTSYVEVILKPGAEGVAPEVVSAWREDVLVVPNSYGGDTSGVQVPFTVNYSGNRVKGNFNITTKTFSVPEGA